MAVRRRRVPTDLDTNVTDCAMGETLVPLERIRRAILLLRGQKVLLDRDLAVLYGVPTKVLKQAVKRNAGRFPEDFMFVLTRGEFAEWRSQFQNS